MVFINHFNGAVCDFSEVYIDPRSYLPVDLVRFLISGFSLHFFSTQTLVLNSPEAQPGPLFSKKRSDYFRKRSLMLIE